MLDHGDLVIKIKLQDYQLPSQLHGSKICVGLSWSDYNSHLLQQSLQEKGKAVTERRKSDFAEQCFDEVPDFTFQANGLSPGTQYALRIVLYGKLVTIETSTCFTVLPVIQ